ncbi:MAG: hypothetical protein JWN83_995 [Chitinophagaceae bacterium]|nr:hypothetical protein [Chitinophagaceae bacterium]
MKTNSTQQEILLLTGTKFSARHCCEKDDSANNHLTEREQLEEACWNGLLHDMLPEICEQSPGKKLYLWHIRETKSFIEIDLGELPEEKEKYSSIDPYSFLPTCFLS